MNDLNLRDTNDVLSGLRDGAEKPYAACRQLADRVADLLETDLPEALSCLERIATAFEHADHETERLAIENGFLFQLGNRIFSSGRQQQLLGLIPESLHDALMRQMLTTGL